MESLDHIHYQYLKCPNPTDQTIVLIHGLGMDSTVWDELLPYITKSFHILRYDLPGHGLSEDPTVELTWNYLEKVLYTLVGRTANEPTVHFVTHGFGGALVLQLAKRYPDLAKTLTIISPHATFYASATPNTEDLFTEIRKHGNAGPIGRVLKRILCFTPSDYQMDQIEDMYQRLTASVYLRLMQLVRNTASLQDVRVSKTPTQILLGTRDPLTPFEAAEYIREQLPNVQIIPFHNAANCVQIDQPLVTARTVIEFIQSFRMKNEDPHFSEAKNYIKHIMNPTRRLVPDVEIRCLGDFRVWVQGEAVIDGWNQRNAKALLMYMTLHEGATRDELCELLWPELDATRAKNRLRVSLNYLRSLLSTKASSASLIVTDHEHVYLMGNIRCDVVELRRELRGLLALTGITRAEKIESIITGLPTPLLLSSLDYHPILAYWWVVERALVDMIQWAIDYYEELNEVVKAQSLATYAMHILPGEEFVNRESENKY
ncbi:alpha/beta hydrolase [Alicyclobacillus ferrooxydans]|uniref:AB hydrolase-1 domain-containing protein n=1 Tax=Alicyclobacillus ferrooxydans TaxID=471514 RepID=A0A0P9ENT9_9BACL|nr:alpha/beta hydrolase [Alicyclobacillus ferrooxydans]KPV45134.1 hypothetical protein AN477_03890 [Alicyclobacillus ferrooxydans]